MNEKLMLKLSEQARKYVDTIPYGVDRENEYIWKLSELIVDECLSICEELGDKGMDGHYCADKISRTFRS
jgi:hypothetical protein